MSEQTTIELSPGAVAIIRRLGATGEIMRAVARAMNTQNQSTVDAIAEKRLSGKGPFPVGKHRLGERTHRLRPSLRRTAATVSGSTVVSAIGSNVVYAGAHEFGVDKEVTVKPHARKRFEVQTFLGAGKRKVSRRVRKADTFVGVGKRHMRLPARAPITTGVQERIPIMGAAISTAIIEGWKEKGSPA